MDAARWRKASTREHCTALYPGSNPGRASSLRSLCELRLGKAATHLSQRSERRLPRHSPKGSGGLDPPLGYAWRGQPATYLPCKCRLTARFWGFRGCEIWSKDRLRARACLTQCLEGRAECAPFFCAYFPAAIRET